MVKKVVKDESSSDEASSSDEEVTTTKTPTKNTKKKQQVGVKRKREESTDKKATKKSTAAPRKKKKKKDPNEPKKPKTGYLRFCDDNRKQVQTEVKSNDVKLVSKELGRMWKELDAKTKAEYNEAFAKDNVTFKVNLQEYKANKPLSPVESSSEEEEPAKKKAKKKKKKVDPNAPKRPLTGYMLFAKEVRPSVVAKFPELKTPDISKELGKMWKALTEEERQRYNNDYREKKKVFDTDLKQYKEDHPEIAEQEEEEEEETPKKGKKAATPKKKKDPNAPKAPPNSFNLFSADIRQQVKDDNPTLDHKQIAKIIGNKWKEADKKTKEKYAAQAGAKKETYDQLLKNYEASQKKQEKIEKSKKSTSKTQQVKRKKNNVIDDEDSDEESDDEGSSSEEEGSGGESSSDSSDSDSD
jgi:hypothetical protein